MIAAALGVGVSQGWMTEVAHAATGGLIAAVWQGVVLSLLVALGLRLLPKTPAAVRFAIWFGVFLVVAALPSVELWHRGGVTAASGHAAWFTLDERWCLIVAAAWGIASLVRAVTLLLAVLRVRTLWKRAKPLELALADGAYAAEPHEVAMPGEQRGSRSAELCVSGEVDRPTVIGFFSPKILIPAWLVEKLTAAELEQIVLHEAGHLSRADDWMNLLQKIALVVFPLNPALAWVERRLCFERELACDERVLETTGAPKAYAACLASLAEHRLGRRGLALALGALGRESELGRRVRRILCRGERMRPLHARLVLGAAIIVLLSAAAGLERCPQMVGFASNSGEVAIASEPVRPDFRVRDGYSYQAVVFHPRALGSPVFDSRAFHSPVFHSQNDSTSRLGTTAIVAREVNATGRPGRHAHAPVPAMHALLQASQTEGAEARGMTGAASSQLLRSEDVSYSDATFNDAKSQSVVAQAGTRTVVQWVVVTSWRGDDGSRVVLTTLRTASMPSADGVVPDRSTSTNARGPQDQVHPYAAVPVRDGWLVIQL